MKGYAWGGLSVLLVTVAQLLMKWGVVQLPVQALNFVTLSHLSLYWQPLIAVIVGISGYGLSLLCWFFTLRYLPLSRAYPILSISYVLVYIAAVSLPWFHETATLLKTIGTATILFGVWLINCRSPKNHLKLEKEE